MLKIVAGKYRSRIIEVPEEGTVPTKNRVREAMLSSLGEQIAGARVADIFAGSGALGIETLSRGAKSCYFVENNPKSARIIEKNLATLKESGGQVLCMDALSSLAKMEGPLDIVFLDPPYAMKEIYQQTVDALWRQGLLHPQSTLILEYEGSIPFDTSCYADVREKHYGLTHVLTLRKEKR